MHQNIWNLKKELLHRQKRRVQLVNRSLEASNVKTVLDIGCSEGYATSFLCRISNLVVGVEINLDTLRIAKGRVREALFINASINHLPFRSDFFDAVCILEVLEHLPTQLQEQGLDETDRVLRTNGVLLISTPYKEQISYTRCIHCEKPTPLWGHLHTLDEKIVGSLLPQNYKLLKKQHLPNVALISGLQTFEPLPLSLWLLINSSLGLLRKGYWVLLKYIKASREPVLQGSLNK
jgi:SAM-dependent methyltransferase